MAAWRRGRRFYLAADETTVWAEWYRWRAEAGLGPGFGLSRDLWRFAVELPRVADLSTRGALAHVHTLEELMPANLRSALSACDAGETVRGQASPSGVPLGSWPRSLNG